MLPERSPLKVDSETIGQAVDVKAPLAGWQAFVLLIAILLLCYASVLVTPYAFWDDYPALVASLRGETWIRATHIAGGRWTYVLLWNLFFPYTSSVEDLRYLRLLGVIGIALLAWSLYRKLVLVGWSSYQAICLSMIISTLPPFQVYASWAIQAFHPFAAIAAGWAFSVAEKAFEESRSLYRWGLAGVSVLLVSLALTIYQPPAMFYWVFAAIVLFQPEATLPCILRRFLWYSSIAFVGSLLGFGVYKLGMVMYSQALPPTRTHLVQDVWGKALWFFRGPFIDALNLAKLFPSPHLALSIAIFIMSGLLLYFRGEVKERLLKFVVAFSIIPLSYLPNLVIAENWSAYRTQTALTSVIAVYAFLALWGYGQILRRLAIAPIVTTGLGFAALTSGFLAAGNVSTYFAFPLLLERKFMHCQLARKDLSQARSIYIIGSTWRDSLAPAVRYDEFGLPASAQPWSLEPQIVYMLLREVNPELADMPITVAPANGPINPPPDALVVDMHKLSAFR